MHGKRVHADWATTGNGGQKGMPCHLCAVVTGCWHVLSRHSVRTTRGCGWQVGPANGATTIAERQLQRQHQRGRQQLIANTTAARACCTYYYFLFVPSCGHVSTTGTQINNMLHSCTAIMHNLGCAKATISQEQTKFPNYRCPTDCAFLHCESTVIAESMAAS